MSSGLGVSFDSYGVHSTKYIDTCVVTLLKMVEFVMRERVGK